MCTTRSSGRVMLAPSEGVYRSDRRVEMRQGQTRWWSACAVIMASLGMSGIVATGCGDDDDTPPGTGGSGGTAGRDGGAGKAGSGGTGGGKGGAGGAEAGVDVTTAQCRMGVDSGMVCTDLCFCTSCPNEAY